MRIAACRAAILTLERNGRGERSESASAAVTTASSAPAKHRALTATPRVIRIVTLTMFP